LPADVWQSLSASLHGGKPVELDAHKILRDDGDTDYSVLVSPVFGDGHDIRCVAGVLVQLIPQHSSSEKPLRTDSSYGHTKLDTANTRVYDLSELGQEADNVPLDQHPFFRRFVEMLPSGLAILDQRAQAIFVNQHFYDLTTHRGEDKSFMAWPQSIHPDDYERVLDAYRHAFESQQQLRIEFRALGQQYPWRLLLLTPLGDENLQHISLREYGGFICSIVDISSEKNAVFAEREAAKEARDRKERQERYIDMISHEIRNPLSAILHCTEDIEEAIRKADDHGKLDVGEISEALDTINLCIGHQRNIVDDVLSFSKLDASMLSLRPKACDPIRQLANTLKMFQPEFRKQDIGFDYRIDTTYKDLRIEWVMADFARVGQVLVNVVTNAIKFTSRSEGEKSIIVAVGASRERPTCYPPNVIFSDYVNSDSRVDATNTTDWGAGEDLFIMVAVKDTGIGINEEGQRKLFERFRQATPKTEEMYGGSGLGLSISRKLCHLHGGEIGVAAEEGSGSTFAFFFKAKRTAHVSEERMKDDEVQDEDELRSMVTRKSATPNGSKINENFQSLNAPSVSSNKEVNHTVRCRDNERYSETEKVAGEVHQVSPESHEVTERPVNLISRSTRKERPSHILLVEDNEINRKLACRKLERKGFKVSTANNGQEAVDAVKVAPRASSGDSAAIDVILMDQEMPVMEGNAAAEEIRRLERVGSVDHVPIVGVTANVRGAQQDKMIRRSVFLAWSGGKNISLTR
jgi:signal transduction histidine kinase